MKLTMDRAGRVVVPKSLRKALGMPDGGDLDGTVYGAGLSLVPTGATARLIERGGHLVAVSETVVDDTMIFALMDAARK